MFLDRLTLERRQVWLYLLAIAAGLAYGSALPAAAAAFESLLWPVLALLLYATFVQVPLLELPAAFRDHRFTAAALLGNFVLMPLAAWALAQGLPPQPALRLGVLLVLLMPCTDWFITFTQLGRGDASRALAITPANLLLQLALLPFYLWLMLGGEAAAALGGGQLPATALLLIVVPLVLAALTERWAHARPVGAALRDRLAWFPVPLLALVLLLIAAAQVGAVRSALPLLPVVLPVFLAYLALALLAAALLGRAFGLPAARRRTLAFGFGTRNSFVVLPLALALPAGYEAAVVVIVFQSLVELFGMVAFLHWVPRLFAGDEAARTPS